MAALGRCGCCGGGRSGRVAPLPPSGVSDATSLVFTAPSMGGGERGIIHGGECRCSTKGRDSAHPFTLGYSSVRCDPPVDNAFWFVLGHDDKSLEEGAVHTVCRGEGEGGGGGGEEEEEEEVCAAVRACLSKGRSRGGGYVLGSGEEWESVGEGPRRGGRGRSEKGRGSGGAAGREEEAEGWERAWILGSSVLLRTDVDGREEEWGPVLASALEQDVLGGVLWVVRGGSAGWGDVGLAVRAMKRLAPMLAMTKVAILVLDPGEGEGEGEGGVGVDVLQALLPTQVAARVCVDGKGVWEWLGLR